MNEFNRHQQMMLRVARAMGGDLLQKMAFVGGCTTGLLLTDAHARRQVQRNFLSLRRIMVQEECPVDVLQFPIFGVFEAITETSLALKIRYPYNYFSLTFNGSLR